MSVRFLNSEGRLALKWGLPSLDLCDFPSVFAVKHPDSDDLFIIKTRYERSDTVRLKDSDFTYLSEEEIKQGNCKHLHGKNVIIGVEFLNREAREFVNGLI